MDDKRFSLAVWSVSTMAAKWKATWATEKKELPATYDAFPKVRFQN